MYFGAMISFHTSTGVAAAWFMEAPSRTRGLCHETGSPPTARAFAAVAVDDGSIDARIGLAFFARSSRIFCRAAGFLAGEVGVCQAGLLKRICLTRRCLGDACQLRRSV